MKHFLIILGIILCCPFITLGQNAGSVSVSLAGRTVYRYGTSSLLTSTPETGVIVIQINVDQSGEVKKASVEQVKTTIKDKELCDAALEAAINTRFNISPNALKLQAGTITYKFGEAIFKSVSVKDLVESYKSGAYSVTAKYVETCDSSRLVFLIEEEDYVIPVQLAKNDLGAEKRFQALNLKKGDVVAVCGYLNRVEVNKESFKGLTEAKFTE